MLGFKRVCLVCMDRVCLVCRVACKLLMQIPCDSEFLVMGDEMHLFCIGSTFPAFPAFPVPRFPRFPLFAWSRYLFIPLAIWPGTGPLARVSRAALLYSNKLQNTFLPYLLAIVSMCSL